MNMIVTIHQPQYLPWLGYFDKAVQADVFILLDNVQFKKNEWQNRNRIRTAQGWQWLTVPVVHEFGLKINEVRINNMTPWGSHHLKAIELNYTKAPFFKEYFPYFQEALGMDWEFLSDLNIYFIRLLIRLLGITTPIELSSQYQARDHKTNRLVDLCAYFKATGYLSGQGGAAYLEEDHFKEQGIEVITQHYTHPEYPQCWMHREAQGFISHLSVIDLLFNCGPGSLKILSNLERNQA